MIMKKINDTLVKIENPKLIELAHWGRLLEVKTTYPMTTLQGCNGKLLYKLVQSYMAMHDYLVYPLNAIESPIKYSYIATYMLSQCSELTEDMIDIKRGLLIKLGAEHYVHFINSYWYLVKDTDFKSCYTLQKNKLGSTEFEWVLKALASKMPSSTFYEQFMPTLYQAFLGDVTQIQTYLENIFTFNSVIPPCTAGKGAIVDVTNNHVYNLVIYPVCKVKLPSDVNTISVSGNKAILTKEYEYRTAYDFCVKAVSEQFLTTDTLQGIYGLPYESCLTNIVRFIGSEYNGCVQDAYYRVFRTATAILFELGNKIYISYMRDTRLPQQLAYNSRILNIKDNIAYIESIENINLGTRIVYYAYNLTSGIFETKGISYKKVAN